MRSLGSAVENWAARRVWLSQSSRKELPMRWIAILIINMIGGGIAYSLFQSGSAGLGILCIVGMGVVTTLVGRSGKS